MNTSPKKDKGGKWKKCSLSIYMKELQIKTTMRDYYVPIKDTMNEYIERHNSTCLWGSKQTKLTYFSSRNIKQHNQWLTASYKVIHLKNSYRERKKTQWCCQGLGIEGGIKRELWGSVKPSLILALITWLSLSKSMDCISEKGEL